MQVYGSISFMALASSADVYRKEETDPKHIQGVDLFYCVIQMDFEETQKEWDWNFHYEYTSWKDISVCNNTFRFPRIYGSSGIMFERVALQGPPHLCYILI